MTYTNNYKQIFKKKKNLYYLSSTDNTISTDDILSDEFASYSDEITETLSPKSNNTITSLLTDSTMKYSQKKFYMCELTIVLKNIKSVFISIINLFKFIVFFIYIKICKLLSFVSTFFLNNIENNKKKISSTTLKKSLSLKKNNKSLMDEINLLDTDLTKIKCNLDNNIKKSYSSSSSCSSDSTSDTITTSDSITTSDIISSSSSSISSNHHKKNLTKKLNNKKKYLTKKQNMNNKKIFLKINSTSLIDHKKVNHKKVNHKKVNHIKMNHKKVNHQNQNNNEANTEIMNEIYKLLNV